MAEAIWQCTVTELQPVSLLKALSVQEALAILKDRRNNQRQQEEELNASLPSRCPVRFCWGRNFPLRLFWLGSCPPAPLPSILRALQD
ncbi:Hypothetical predicted protein [Podarcis lilfordi]|uniref:Uncharacterized protein n=1 Tax=Podarcis lilfordi TaxID=74358 RepID=A0AA35KWE8_9SAUR|nr:Hypothetical predicted protein [Podarcis lilfordi]